MNNKEEISFVPNILRLTELAIAIQNKGIATVFVSISGHITSTSIKIYAPEWAPRTEESYSVDISSEKTFKSTEQTLLAILEHGEIAIPGIKEKREKERKNKIAMLARIKTELEAELEGSKP